MSEHSTLNLKLNSNLREEYRTLTNQYDPGQLYILIFNILDNLEELKRTQVLTDIIWEVNSDISTLETNWRQTEALLKSYEKYRDESLDIALFNVKELINFLSDKPN